MEYIGLDIFDFVIPSEGNVRHPPFSCSFFELHA